MAKKHKSAKSKSIIMPDIAELVVIRDAKKAAEKSLTTAKTAQFKAQLTASRARHVYRITTWDYERSLVPRRVWTGSKSVVDSITRTVSYAITAVKAAEDTLTAIKKVSRERARAAVRERKRAKAREKAKAKIAAKKAANSVVKATLTSAARIIAKSHPKSPVVYAVTLVARDTKKAAKKYK